MTIYTPDQLLSLWTANGGNPLYATVAASFALAESGGDSNAISSTDDYGLWQINRSNFNGLGIVAFMATDPDTNARAAITLSSNGTDWGDWCTGWVDPQADCGHHPLPLPEVGSPAYGKFSSVFGGGVDVAGAPIGTDNSDAVQRLYGLWGDMQSYFSSGVNGDIGAVSAAQAAMIQLRQRMGA